MSSRFKKSLSGLMAVVTVVTMGQLSPVIEAAAELADSLAVDFTDGDVNGDGKTNEADVEAMYAYLGKSASEAAKNSKYDVYKDGTVDVRDLMAVRALAEGETPEKPENEASGDTVKIEVQDAECVPGEQVSIDVNIVDWDQDLGAAEFYLDFDSSLSLVDVVCKGDYRYVSEDNELKLYGMVKNADVYRGTVATLTFDVPDTAYGDYDVKVKSCAVYNEGFQSLKPTTKVGLIAADVTERPLYLAPSYINSKSLRMTWSMPYCSGNLEGYIVYRDGKEIARTSDTYYYDEGLEIGTKYVYEVQAYGAENYLSAKSKAVTATPQGPVINALSFPDNATVIGGKSAELRATMEKTVDASEYSLTYTDLQGEEQTIFSGENTALSAADIRWNLKDIPSGDYTLTFSVTDRDGASAEKSLSVTVDTTPPEQVFGFDVFEGEEEMKLTWGIAAEAKVVGYNIYRRTETGAYSLLKYIDGRDVLEYKDKNLEEGDIYFYMMCAVDKFGQEGIYSDEKSAAAKGDETLPEITLFLPESGKVLSHYVTISIKADDNVGVSSVAAYISEDDGETWTKLFEAKGSSASYSLDTTQYTATEVKIKALAYDYAGNESNAITHLYAIDNAGPAQVTNIRAAAVGAVTATIAWDDVPDDDFSYFTAKYYPTEDNKAVRVITTHSTLGVNITGLTPDTSYTIEVAAVDIYGNIGEYSEPFEFTTVSDTVAPIIASFRPTPGYYNKSIPLAITAQDDFSTASVTIQITDSNAKDAEWKDVATVENANGGEFFNASYTLDLADFADGTIYLRAFATDEAGNVGETSAVYEYIVDKTAPAAPTAFKASSDANAIELTWEVYENKVDSVYFSLYRSEEEDGEYVKILDKSNSINYFDRAAEPGTTYFYKLTAIDAAGNESPMSKAVSAVLQEDKEAPEIVSISPEDGSLISTVYNSVSVLASDNVKLASVTMEYRLNENAEYKTFAEFTDINNYYIVAEGKLPKAALTGESVQVRITAEDTAGLAAEAKEVTFKVNNTSTAITKIKAEQLTDHIALTWTAEENELSTGYYIYKRENTGSWQRIGGIAVDPAKQGSYEFTDYSANAAGTVVYKVEAYSSNGMVTEKTTAPVQIYTNPTASLVVENAQQQNVEYIFDATGCRDYYGIESIVLDYGDGTSDRDNSAATAKFIHKYTETGIYKVTLTCTNEQGLVSEIEQIIEVIPRVLMGQSTVTVKTTDGKAASNINVYIDLGTDRQKKLTTDASGKLTFDAVAGIHTIGVFGDGYLPAEKECTILAGSGNRFDFVVTQKEIVTADFKVERMKLDEIKAAGIDITAPENQHIVEVELNLSYKAHDNGLGSLRFYVNSKGNVVGGGGGFGLFGWGGASWGGSGSSTVTRPVYVYVNPETNEVDTLVTMTVPVKASFLKEFFHASLTVYNNADEQYNISQNQVKLNLPAGLSLVDAAASDPEIVNFDTLPGQSSKDINWIIRGDVEGVYDISASYSGHLDRFNEDITAEFTPDEPITVYGEKAVSVNVLVPEQLMNNKFIFEVQMTNNSPVDVYCPNTNVGAIISSAFGNSGSSYPSIKQRSIKQNGKYVRILSSDEPTLDILEPGYTYSVVYVADGVFSNIDGVGKDYFYSSRLDLVSASIQVMNGSRIPVSLTIVPNSEFIIIDKIIEIEYDPETEFVLGVTGGSHSTPLEGATVVLGDQTATTNAEGYVILNIPEEFYDLKVSCDGYIDKTILSYTGYVRGIDTITLSHTRWTYDSDEDDDDDTPGVTNPDVGYQGDSDSYIAVPEAFGDPDDDEYEGKPLVGELEFGDDFSFKFNDDIPVIGGMNLEIKDLKLPLTGGVDDEGFAYIQIGEWSPLPDDDDDDDDDVKYIQKAYKDAVEAFNEYRNMSVKEAATKIKDAGNPIKNPTVEPEIKIIGILSARYDTRKGLAQCVREGGVTFRGSIQVKIGVELGWKNTLIVAGVVPVAIEVKAGIGIEANASFSMTSKGGGEIEFAGSLVVTGELTGEVFAGVGAAGVIAAGVYGNVGLSIEITLVSSDPDDLGVNSIEFKWDIGAKAYVGPFSYSKSFFNPDPIRLYPKEDSGNKNALAEINGSIYNPGSYVLDTNKYASEWAGGVDVISSGDGYLDLNVMASGIIDTPMQQLAVVDGHLVMTYLDSDSSRNAVNAYRLMYSVFDEKTGWSKPAQVDSDKTGDYAPYLWSDGSQLYLIYQNAAEGLDDDAAITDWTAAQNIAVSKFDTKTLKFGEPTLITNDSKTYNRAPAIAVSNGRTYAVWTSNTDTDYFGTNNTNALMISELGENGWTAPETIAENLSSVTQLIAADHDDELYVVYITDDDNDLSTTDDRTLHAFRQGELQSYIIAEGSVSSATFTKAAGDETACLYWQQNGNIRRSEDFTVSRVLFDEDTAAVAGDFTIAGDRILLAAADEEKESNLYESVFDAETGKWGAAVKLTAQGQYIENVSAVEYGGEVIAVMNRKNVTITEDSVDTANSIVTAKIENLSNLAVRKVTYRKSSYVKGKTMPVMITVENKGDRPVDSAVVSIADENGETVYETTIEETIPVNGTKEILADLDFDPEKTSEYVVSVSSASGNDCDMSDNSYTLSTLFSLMEVTAKKTGKNTVEVTVTNNGTAAGSEEVSFYEYKSGTVLDTISFTDIKPGESVKKTIRLSDYELSENDIAFMGTDSIFEEVLFDAVGGTLPGGYTLGDINKDGFINASDASMALSEYAAQSTGKESVLTDEEKAAADVNSDGHINSSDASAILAYYSAASTGGNPSFD